MYFVPVSTCIRGVVQDIGWLLVPRVRPMRSSAYSEDQYAHMEDGLAA